MKMSHAINIPKARLISQQLLKPRFDDPKTLVEWMGAMQAQNYSASIEAICLRLPSARYEDVESAFNRGEILRTHVLRPTWHLVSSADIRWMLDLTSARIKKQAQAHDLMYGLTEDIFAKSSEVFVEALRGGKNLLREELAQALESAGLDVSENRMYHYLMRAELDAVICSGALRGKNQTYALLSERAPKAKQFDRETSLEMLARRYFTSRGPATLKDFIWWSGLTTTEARQAIDIADSEIVSTDIDGQTYFHVDMQRAIEKVKISSKTVHMLPAFDEYLVAYADRSAVIAPEHKNKAITSNGIFRPTILHGGTVVGTWKTAGKKTEESYF